MARRATHMLCLAAFWAACLCATESLADESTGDITSNVTPRGDIRVVYHADGHPANHHLLPYRPKAEDLHDFVDELARNDVDVFSELGYTFGQVLWKSEHAEGLFSKWGANAPLRVRLETLWASGVEPLAVWAKRSHEKGMKFLVKFRMNDRHSQGKLTGPFSRLIGQFLRDHQEWWLKAYPGGLDFTHQGVRDWMFTLAEEVTGKFDIDGLTFNYIRYPYVFEPAESQAKQPILTDFMRRVRKMLDEEGTKKGREMLFCVIVPLTIDECHMLGLDVPTWIEEKIIDIVCPSDWGSSDFDAPYEEFARLTRKSECLLFPAVHPYPERDTYEWILMSLPAYRGLAKNFYAPGADGVSIFNYQYHWEGYRCIVKPGRMYPEALAYLAELRDPVQLAREDRHYISYPIRGHFDLRDRTRKIVLSRGDTPTFKRYVLQAAEDWTGKEKAIVRFVAKGLLPDDEITVKFNGGVVPGGKIKRTHHAEGRTDLNEGAELPAYTVSEFVPTTSPETPCKQVLEIALTKGAPDATDKLIVIPEIEVAVSAGGGDPLEVMMQTRYRTGSPAKVLAGHHPHRQVLWAQFKATGQQAGVVGSGAQSFVLAKKARVTAVDIAMAPSTPGNAPREGDQGGVLMTVQGDADGKPEGNPVSDGATVRYLPWEHVGEITTQFQGYYKFTFPEALTLERGTYWMVLKKGPGGGDFTYSVYYHMSQEHAAGQWMQGDTISKERWTFFGVHGEYLED